MLEAEASRRHTPLIVERNVANVLLTAHAVALTTVCIHLDGYKLSHCLVKAQVYCLCCTTYRRPLSIRVPVLLEGLYPGVDWLDDSVVQLRKIVSDVCHCLQVLGLRVVDIPENQVGRRADLAILIEDIKEGECV